MRRAVKLDSVMARCGREELSAEDAISFRRGLGPSSPIQMTEMPNDHGRPTADHSHADAVAKALSDPISPSAHALFAIVVH